jgi:tripartite-type tricarboxylate transporter receptor subunit TctC
MNLKWKQLALAIVATLWVAAGVAAEDYPTKPVRLLVGFSPGSATGIIAQNADVIRRANIKID